MRAVFSICFLMLVAAPVIGQIHDPSDSSASAAGGVTTATRVSASETEEGSQSVPNSRGNPKENPAEPEAHGTRLKWQDLPKNILRDEKAIFTSPFHINRDNLKWWLLFGGGTAALIATDKRFSDHLPESKTQLRVGTWASRAGADYTIYPLTAAFYFVGKAGNNPRARDTSRIGIEALADAEIIVNVLKFATQRQRPEHRGDSVAFWKSGNGFPSGHSIQAWALARVIGREFPEHRFYPILAYSLATTVGAARIVGRRHSPSDVLAGSAMGFFIGDFVYRHHHAPSAKENAAFWIANHVKFQVSQRVQP